MERPRPGVWTVVALVTGLLLRLWFVQHAPTIAGDALIYGGIAKNLLLHGIYGFNQDSSGDFARILPTLIRLPGYPLFLAGCFRIFGMEHYRSAIYMQVFADLWTCLLAAGLARRLFGWRAWLPVLFAGVLCPFTANYVAVAITETLVLWTIALAFYGLRRWQEEGAGLNRWMGVAGFALAWSVLLRPDQGLLSVAVVPAMGWICWRTGKRTFVAALGPAAVVSLCVLLPLVPWTARNWKTFRVFQPLAPRLATDPGERPPVGFNLWYRTWGIDFVSTDEVYWNMNGAPIAIADLPARAFSTGCRGGSGDRRQLPLYPAAATLLARYNHQGFVDTPDLDDGFAQLAAKRMDAAPLCVHVLLPLARLANMLTRPRLELTAFPDRWWESPVKGWKLGGVVLYAVLDVMYLILGAAGAVHGLRRGDPGTRAVLWSIGASVLLRAALLLTLDNSEPRYTLEFFPALFVWMGALFGRTSRRSVVGTAEPGG